MLFNFSSPKLTSFIFAGVNDKKDIPEEMETYAISSMLSRFTSLQHLDIHLEWMCRWSNLGPKAAARMGEAIVRHAAQLKTLAYRDEPYPGFKELASPDAIMGPIMRCKELEELALWMDSSLDIAGLCQELLGSLSSLKFLTILEVARGNLDEYECRSIAPQLRSCAEDVFHSTSLECSELVLRLAREHWSSAKDDGAAHKTHQHDGYEGLIENDRGYFTDNAGNAYLQTLTQQSFKRAKRSSPATDSSSSLLS